MIPKVNDVAQVHAEGWKLEAKTNRSCEVLTCPAYFKNAHETSIDTLMQSVLQ